MKYFIYLKIWEKLLFVLSILMDLIIIWIIIRGMFGLGEAALLYTIQQTIFTLMHRGLQRIPKSQLDEGLKKRIESDDRNKTLWLGFNLKATAFLWVVSLLIFFVGFHAV